MEAKIKLGDQITFTHTLERRTKESGDHITNYKVYRSYEDVPFRKGWKTKAGEPCTGIIVGQRTLQVGEVSGAMAESSYERALIIKETIPAYLVAYDLNRKPVLVRRTIQL